MVLRSFPVTPHKTLSEFTKILTEKYFIRLVLRLKNIIKDESTITDLKKSIEIDKHTGQIKFDPKNHLQKILHNNRVNKEFDEYFQRYQQANQKSFLVCNEAGNILGVFNISEIVRGPFHHLCCRKIPLRTFRLSIVLS